jgi:nucleotide-binding universal stress UspA family protein
LRWRNRIRVTRSMMELPCAASILVPRASAPEHAMYSRILVPVDGSEPSQCGLREAIGIARDNGSTLVLLHVIVQIPVTLGYPGVADYGQVWDMLDHAGKEIVERAGQGAAAAGVAFVTRLVDGGVAPACDVIVAQAETERCELIVMGTHGRRGMKRLALGSDAELVVRHSTVPVLLVKPGPAAQA